MGRFKFPKTVMFIITGLSMILILATALLYWKEPYLKCAQQLLTMQGIALLIHSVLNYFNYRSNDKIVILATLFIGTMIFSGVLSSFFNLELMCRYFNYR